jgi:hypothetical protein
MSNHLARKPLFDAVLAATQAAMLKKPQVQIEVVHVFVNGMCARTIMIPADVELVGAVHLTDHVNIMCGDITLYSSEGEKRLSGYHVIPSPAGVKRAGRTHAPTCWTTILRTDLTTAEEVEEQLTAKDHDDPRVLAIKAAQAQGEDKWLS